ncbi:hypothetical protein J5J10_10510 [Ciceribacter sp. L1K23]|uniref:hypothetical protein n=1 Tax=Ciceribacter sp. L1K23 TaxID=2820276 RepID=UPI001B83FACA|nr:hypothetical protein [Ciceribacter sp. L1K23]MBR0556108.1 hypothetical protein [Ciceribacter sp. L1K23]
MTEYKLDIEFSGDIIQTIGGGQKLVIAKPVSGDAAGNSAWLTLNPFDQNKIDWTEDYKIYSEQATGAQSVNVSDVAAQPPINLTFDGDFFIA